MITAAVGSLTSQKSFITLIGDADVVVQLVVLLLIMACVWAGTIIIAKLIGFKRIKRRASRFERLFTIDRVNRIDFVLDQLRNSNPTAMAPIEQIFISMAAELKRYTSGKTHLSADEQYKIRNKLDLIFTNAKNRHINDLESNLSYLATISSASPFIGLFGTVWGIMDSFQAIAMSKNTSLAVVAPGIAEALLATAIGLVAAIPALIFYNVLIAQVNEIENSIDNFSPTLNATFSHALGNHLVKAE